MTKNEKQKKRQTKVNITIHRKLKTEQQESHINQGQSQVSQKGKQILLCMRHLSCSSGQV